MFYDILATMFDVVVEVKFNNKLIGLNNKTEYIYLYACRFGMFTLYSPANVTYIHPIEYLPAKFIEVRSILLMIIL